MREERLVETLKQRFFGLCVPPLLLDLADNTLTLVGQPAEYWAGNYARVNEMSPTFHDLLRLHPAAFVAGGLVWIMVFVGGILLLPRTLALIASLAITIGHASCASTWLLYRYHYGYQLACALFLGSAILIGVGVQWGWRALPEREYRLSGWPPLVRWALAGLCFGVSVYLFLWPRTPGGAARPTDEGPAAVVEAVASTDRELEELGDRPQIKELCLVGTEITSAGLERLKGLADLETLTLRGLHVDDAGMRHLGQLDHLKTLRFEHVRVPDRGLRHFGDLPHLEHLTFIGAEITDSALEQFDGPPHLRVLFFGGPQITDAGLQHLKRLPELEALLLHGASVTDAGLEHLKGLTQLRTLNLRGTRVTGAGLKHLKALSHLQHLDLGETKVMDEGLAQLEGMPQLIDVYLGCTNCTPQGKKHLKDSLPKCHVGG